MHPDLCQLIEDDEQCGLRFEIDKHRISIRTRAEEVVGVDLRMNMEEFIRTLNDITVFLFFSED